MRVAYGQYLDHVGRKRRDSGARLPSLQAASSGLIAVAYKRAAYVHSPQTAKMLETVLSTRIDLNSRQMCLACLISSVLVFKITTNCVFPVANASDAATVANGNDTRRDASVASVVVVPTSAEGSILINVESSLALVTAAIVAPASMRLATARRLAAFVWAGEHGTGVTMFPFGE